MRSEDMNLYKLIMSKDQEYFITNIIGQCAMAHFINVNQDEQVFKLQYADMVRRCDESERKVAFIIQQCKVHDIHLNKIDSVESMGDVLRDVARERQVSLETLFESVEKEVNEIQEFIL